MIMHFDWSTLALQTINFAILVWLLHRFLYKPVLRMIDARRVQVDKQYADARAAEARAREHLAAIEVERAGIASERVSVLKAATVQAEQAAAARRSQAERDATALLDAARTTLARERDAARAEVRQAALDFGVEVASRLVAVVPVKLRAEAWLERIGQHLAALPKSELDALRRQLANGAFLKVITVSALPPETTDTWRLQLRRTLGDRIAISFDVDQRLVAGAELHFPNAVIRFSWQSALASIRAEIETYDNPH
jgi:F-type H+-transporting ATPase subunit b